MSVRLSIFVMWAQTTSDSMCVAFNIIYTFTNPLSTPYYIYQS